MTGELYRNGNDFDFIYEDAKKAAAHVKKQVKAVPKKVDGISAWIGAMAIGLVVFFICGLSCASSRGFSIAIGGEFIFAAVVTLVVKRLIDKLRFCFNK